MQRSGKKLNVIFFLCFLPAAIYLGYSIGLMYGENITLDNLKPQLVYALLHFWPPRITPWTWKGILICSIIWFVIFLRVTSQDRDVKPGTEYGTAAFGTCKEINKKLEDPDPSKNKILSQNLRMSLDTHRTGLNNNVIVIGGSGAGKSFYFVQPNGFLANSSMALTDPKILLLQREQMHLLFLQRFYFWKTPRWNKQKISKCNAEICSITSAFSIESYIRRENSIEFYLCKIYSPI